MYKIFEFLTEIAGWLQIALSPTLLGIGVGLGVYCFLPTQFGLIIGAMIAILGKIIGIVWATKKLKTTGTIYFLSKINAMPDVGQDAKSDTKNKSNAFTNIQ